MSMLLALLGAAAGIPPATAEDVLAAQRRMVTAVTAPAPCEDGQADEVVVCARPDSREYRLRYPELSGPSDLRVPGEPPPINLAAQAGSCGAVGPGNGCAGGLDVFAIAGFLGKLAIKLVDPEHEFEPPPTIPPSRD